MLAVAVEAAAAEEEVAVAVVDLVAAAECEPAVGSRHLAECRGRLAPAWELDQAPAAEHAPVPV